MVLTVTVPADDFITVYLGFNPGQSVSISWGDGSASIWNLDNTLLAPPSHVYANSEDYLITITGSANNFAGVYNGTGTAAPIVSVASWLNSLTNLDGAFLDQPNAFTVPSTLPPNVITVGSMFQNAAAFNQDISGWDTSQITYMNSMFFGAAEFNQPLNTNGNYWNTASVTNMYGMFKNASSFNRPLNSWNTAAVTDMSEMFSGATAFDSLPPTPSSATTNMISMFAGATAFNQDLTSWTPSLASEFNAQDIFNGAAIANTTSKWPTFTLRKGGSTNIEDYR
jgi:surface protein